MKYRVEVPSGTRLQFPDLCPFTDTPAPRGVVRLKKTKTQLVPPVPVGIYNRYLVTRMQIPACQKVATKAQWLEVAMWASLLGGIGIGFLMVATNHSQGQQFLPFLALIGGPILALVFRIQRHVLLRRVYIGKTTMEALELRFESEHYARQFSELNGLSLSEPTRR